MTMDENLDVPRFLKREIGDRSQKLLLKTPEEVREYCLSKQYPNITLTLRGTKFRYKIRRRKDSIGWMVHARVPLSMKAKGVKPRMQAAIGVIRPDFKLKRMGVSLRDDDPLVKAFLEFYDTVFVRNVMKPAEMKIEAEI
jgi:hypothetical protein